jgi:translation elongation factor P/translation initiation factor 5A
MTTDTDFNQIETNEEIKYKNMTKSTYGSLKKGSIAMLKDRPCKILEISISKVGKHGSAKAIVKGSDIITDKIIVTSSTTTSPVWIPLVEKKLFTLVDIEEKGYLELQDESGIIYNYKVNCEDVNYTFIIDNKEKHNLLITILFVLDEHRLIDARINTDE